MTSGSLAGTDTLAGALSRTGGENVGSYPINQGTLANSNYAITYVGNNLGITPRAIGVAANVGQTKVYGNGDPTLAYSITSGSLLGGDTLSGALTRAAGENVGGYPISQGSLSAGTNYSLSFTGSNFGITARPITVTASAGQTKVYGNSDPALAYTLTSGNLVGADTLSGALARTAGENVGAYAINQGTLSAGSNYSLTYAGDAFGITARPITVTANAGQTKAYGAADPALAYGITSGSLFGSDTLSGALARTAGENVGTYPINQGTLSAGSNYLLTYSGDSFAITGRPITVAANAGQTKVYGNADPALGYTITSGSLLGGDALAGSLARAPGENVGSYAINQSTLAAPPNYSLTFAGSNFGITPRSITVTANPASKIYGAPDPALTSGIGGMGLASGDTTASALTGGLSRAAGENAGGYAIGQGTLATTANYSLASYTPATFTINPASLSIRANDASRLAGQPNPAFSASYSGFVLGESPANLGGTLAFSTPATPGSAPGAYPITPSGSTSTNYAISYVDGALNVDAPQVALTTASPQAVVTVDAPQAAALTDALTAIKAVPVVLSQPPEYSRLYTVENGGMRLPEGLGQ